MNGQGAILNWTGSGNVGIGTTNPGAKLDVNGTAIIRSTLYSLKYSVTNSWSTFQDYYFYDFGNTYDLPSGTFLVNAKAVSGNHWYVGIYTINSDASNPLFTTIQFSGTITMEVGGGGQDIIRLRSTQNLTQTINVHFAKIG
jgi:hypothetical protein